MQTNRAGIVHRPWFPDGQAAQGLPCERPCAAAARPFVLAATILASAMAFIDGVVVNIALPAIQRDFQASFGILQWVINGYTLVLGALILTGGALGDRFGRRLVFVCGIAIFTTASIACAFAPSTATLIAARVFQGLGGALLVPQSLAIIAAAFPKTVRGRAIGIWAAAAALTTAAGPLVGGTFIDLLSWRAIFWINIPLAALAIGLALRYIPESRGPVDGPLDWMGSVLATAGLVLIIYALTEIPNHAASPSLLFGLFIAGAGVLVVFWRRESRVAAPLMPPSIFRSPVFNAVNAITLCLYFALSTVFFLLPYALIQVHGYSAFEAGAATLPFGLVMGLFSSRAGRLGDRFGPRIALTVGAGLVALACLAFAVVESTARPSYWLGYLPAILLLSIGMTISVAPLTTAMLNAVSDAETGAASGINNAISRIAGVLAVALAGLVTALVFSHSLAAAMHAIGVAPDLATRLTAQTDKLAALNVPDGVAENTARALRQAIAHAFIEGYRIGMLATALVALSACVLAYVYLRQAPAAGPTDD